MAISFQKRSRGAPGKETSRHTATVRRDGVSISATFPRKDLALKWALGCEEAVVRATESGSKFDRAAWVRRGRDRTSVEGVRAMVREAAADAAPDTDDTPRPDWTLSRALTHYEESVTPKKKSAVQERVRLAAWRARPLAGKRLDRVTPDDLQDHIDRREEAGRAAMTVRNEVLLLSAVYRHASTLPRPGKRREGGWGLTGLANPVATCALPPQPPGRERRLEDGQEEGDPGEEERMLAALAAGLDGGIMCALFVLAIETGMRLSELLDVRPSQLKRVRGARFAERAPSDEPGKNKNGKPRRVVLSTRAAAVLDGLAAARSAADDRPFLALGVSAVEYRWRRAREKAVVQGLTLHDLRHEGLSRMADAGLTIGELQGQSGHKSAQVLLRYVNSKPRDVARKLG